MFRYTTLTATAVATLLLMSVLSPAHAFFWDTSYPGNNCRAALESQDASFRVFNDRYKNQSPSNVFAVCPIPWNAGYKKDDTNRFRITVLNERATAVNITCNIYLHQYPSSGAYTGGSQPYIQQSISSNVPAGEVDILDITVGSSNQRVMFTSDANIVCLLPGNTSIIGYNDFKGDYYD